MRQHVADIAVGIAQNVADQIDAGDDDGADDDGDQRILERGEPVEGGD